MRVVVNNTVLSNLAQIRRPDFLQTLFGDEIVAPSQVLNELAEGERLRRIPVCDWSSLKVVALTQEEQTRATRFNETVDAGEAACLALAQTHGLTFLTDDRDARRLAQFAHVSISGTVGILQLLIDEGHLDLATADQLLAEMIRKGYRSPIKSLKQLEK